MNLIETSIDLLGYKARDRVTLIEGVISSVSFDLFGCVQVLLTPTAKDNKYEMYWYDVKRIEVIGERVMAAPVFIEKRRGEENGPAEKPVPR